MEAKFPILRAFLFTNAFRSLLHNRPLRRTIKSFSPPFFVAGVFIGLACVLPRNIFSAEPEVALSVEFFESKVRPILFEHCYECHSASAKKIEGGLRLDSRKAILRGGDSGIVIVPGKPDESSLIVAVTYTSTSSNMPPRGKLSDRIISDLRQWVASGASMPEDNVAQMVSEKKRTPVIDERSKLFWSFRPVQEQFPKQTGLSEWARQKIDLFILDRLKRERIQPASLADRRTLIRRLYFDLIGLPPSVEETNDFVACDSPDAVDQWVDKLLASPHYGERWGRHWLDVARYAEDNPTNEATCKPPRFAFQYRDWVVRALNEDLPYDEFVRRQLAADLQSDLAPDELAAAGFLGLSPVYHKEPKLAADVIAVIVADEWDERIDTITRGLLGLTVACARCHDHKFDPIRTQDYYALAGVMASTRLVEQPLIDAPADTAWNLQDLQEAIVDTELRLSYAKAMSKTAKLANEPTAPYEKQVAEFEAKLKTLKSTPSFQGPIANSVRDGSVWIDGQDPAWTSVVFRPNAPRDIPVFLRGNPARTGDIVPRRFIEVLSREKPSPFRQGSGRLELANAIFDDARGLASRVIVNRVWGWHFGKPIVRTPSNFGALGDAPSHAELLDDLAARFIDQGWSLKRLHREIVLSSTFHQSSVHTQVASPEDPAVRDSDNRLLWRMNRRRIDGEALRDSILKVTDRLDRTMGGPSNESESPKHFRRTLYGKVSRQNSADVLRLFDFPDAKQHAEERIQTTTPLQQLYLLNSEFMRTSAQALAQADEDSSINDGERLKRMYARVLQRPPTEHEEAIVQRVIQKYESHRDTWRLIAHGLLASNEFLYVD